VKQLGGGRDGNRDASVVGFSRALSNGDGSHRPRGVGFLYHPSRGDKIEDGVQRSDFVEVDLLTRNPVNLAFHLPERFEHAHSSVPNAIGKAALP
jgi:hypothetical protein